MWIKPLCDWSRENAVRQFEELSSQLEAYCSKSETDKSLVGLIDPCLFNSTSKDTRLPLERLREMNPVYTRPEFSSLAAEVYSMLVLAFPEAHWLVLTGSADRFLRPKMDTANGLVDISTLSKFHLLDWHNFLRGMINLRKATGSHYRSLFDPAGLRNAIQYNMRLPNDSLGFLERTKCAAAIDEEEPYAFMHGYLLYKLGYRVHLVTTERMMDELFGNERNSSDLETTFQDIYLNFPDEPEREGRSDLHKRFEERYKGLNRVKRHILVTVGHKHSESYERNRLFILEKKIKRIFKPSGGIYNLLEKAGLLNAYWQRLRKWRDDTDPRRFAEEGASGHSAPGRLLVVAERLNNRAEKILKEADSVQECIRGATLALEASELLGFRTPTTALEATALRHQLEVKAECMFYGVAYNIDVKNRLKEIEMEAKAVARWFHSSVRQRSLLNAQMSIITQIARIFRQYGQFDEEQQCLKHFRDLNRRWYFSSHPWFAFFWPIRWYVETVVGSFALFIIALLTWPLVFGLAGYWLKIDFDASWQVSDHVVNAYSTFFGLQPIDLPGTSGAKALTLLTMFTGFIHLGVFIAHLYTLITRR